MLKDFIDFIAVIGKLLESYYESVGNDTSYGFLWLISNMTNNSDEAIQVAFDYINMA